MRIYRLVWSEIVRRPGQTITALIVVALGVSALVAVESVASSSEQRIARQMKQLGANILVLPDDTTLQDYYAADANDASLPEEYASRITLAQLTGVEELSPRLSVNCELDGSPLILTGVLPRTEFYEQSAWQSVDLMTAELSLFDVGGVGRRHEGCTGRTCQLSTEEKVDLQSYAATRIVHELDSDAVLVGADLAGTLGVQSGQTLRLLDADFRVAGILPATGTIDDDRMFTHLHRVQELTDSGPVVNVIEVMGCCDEVAADLVGELEDLLPDARVVTISQIVEAQVTVNRLVGRLSYVLFAILMVIGGASIASMMFANVTERRRELGTLMALGATPSMVGRIILFKAATVGAIGGAVGLLIGLIAAITIGPSYLGIAVSISPLAVLVGLVAATAVAAIASYLPARRAARLDPCVCLQDL